MGFLIDRRLNPRNKSAVNRQRFLRRYRKHIKGAVEEAIKKRSITDLDRGESVTIPHDDVSEPLFVHGPGGVRTKVYPGNKEFVAGDRIARPKAGGGGSGSGDASDSGEGVDDFVFQITQDEFLEFMFEGLELPNLVKRHLKGNESFKYVRAGFSKAGVPTKLNVVRSVRAAKARRIALTGDKLRSVSSMTDAMEEAKIQCDDLEVMRLEKEVSHLRHRIKRVPFLDTVDLRYNLHVKQPVPTSKAVMFCLMDVSGSMDQRIKDLAKRFFLLLYLFLQRNYDRTDVVFIRHHTTAKEVDEEEFFYSRETGGTVVSSALKLMDEVVTKRYALEEWNIYAAQASDGDNWQDDSPVCNEVLSKRILPKVQHFAYVEITNRDHRALWREYEKLLSEFGDHFALRQIVDANDIYPVFRDLFARRVPQE